MYNRNTSISHVNVNYMHCASCTIYRWVNQQHNCFNLHQLLLNNDLQYKIQFKACHRNCIFPAHAQFLG